MEFSRIDDPHLDKYPLSLSWETLYYFVPEIPDLGV
jgi:hypothetical protein